MAQFHSTLATSNDPIAISLPEEMSHLDLEVTPAMEPLVSLLQNLAKVAPSAIRNKHKLYSIIIRARDICNHLLAIGLGPESVGLETLDDYYSRIDLLEVRLLQAAQLLVAEQGALSPESCASWSKTRAGLVAIMYGLYESPFSFGWSGPEMELANNTFFDDCYWFSFLLHQGIETELGLRLPSKTLPEAVVSVKESLGYLEHEIKHGHLTEKLRECVIDMATRLYENLAALPSTKERNTGSWVRQAELSSIPTDQDALVKELSDVFSALDLESSLQPTEAQKLEEKWLAIVTPSLTAKSGSGHAERRSVVNAPPSPADEPPEQPMWSITGSHTSLLWTSTNPLQSQLFSTLGQLYRFDTVNNGGKMITTLYRSIKQGKEDRIARLEWGANYSLGRAIIGRNMVSMVDLVLPGGVPYYRRFFGPDGYQYTWRPDSVSGDFVLEDYSGNVIVIFRPIFPGKKYNIGEVLGELILVNNTGRGIVLHQPLMDMVCLTAALNRVLNEREAEE